MTDRGASTLLSYVITLAIITVLISGLFTAAGGFVGDQHERTIEAELNVLGNRLAADMAAVDRLATAGRSPTVRLTIDLPELVAGSAYRVELVDRADDRYDIVLSTTKPETEVSVSAKIAVSLVETTVPGGDVEIGYDGDAMEINNV